MFLSTISRIILTSCVFLFVHVIYGQIPNPNDIYRGLPVVPFIEAGNSTNRVQSTYGISEIIEERNKALAFFNVMKNIAEPSTISVLTNFTHNFNDYQKKPFVLDADIQIPIALGGKKWKTGKRIHTIHLIPQFLVRIFRDDSNAPGSINGNVKGDESIAVRTPSTKPRVTYYGAKLNKWGQKDTTRHGKPMSLSKFWGVSVFHHSNGQDGAEFYPDSTINVYNGNFGEQVAFEFFIGRIKDFRHKKSSSVFDFLKSERIGKKDAFSKTAKSSIIAYDFPYNRRFYWKAGLELHWPDPLTSKAFDQYNLYGRYRLNIQTGLAWIPSFRDLIISKNRKSFIQTTPYEAKELFRFVGNFQYILDPQYNDGDMKTQKKVPFVNIKRLNIYGTFYWRMTGSPNSAFFVQMGYWGSDNYNIYFQEQILNFRFGLALASFKYPKLGDFRRDPKR